MMAAPPMLQPYDPTRGIISCFTEHGLSGPISAATDKALCDLLLDHYQEAFRRLPVEDVPDAVDLAQLMDRGGLCLGLLDPVTNIVLNTVSLLSDGFDSPPATLGARNSSFIFRLLSSRGRGNRSRDSWLAVARRSSLALLEFMRAYFGLLTQEQAGRYLVWARADLAMAVLLVEHELYAARPALPDPRSGRTRKSLFIAATHVKLPSPNQLVSLATAWLPSERLDMLAPVLRSRDRLTVHDVKTILHLLRREDDIFPMKTMPPMLEAENTTSCADLGDGWIAYTTIVQRAGDHIASLRRPQDMESTLSSYTTHAAMPEPGTTKDSPCTLDADADSCPYVRSLEMSLYGAIHGFYLRALAMLPSHVARQHVRGVLLAGHCYGPMDPVSNIVLNAIWYDVNFPLRDTDRRTQAHDILDTLTLLRAVSRSLHGLVALLHATSGQKLPLHEILKYLCYTQCDISAMIQPHLHHDGSSPSPFEAATAAAQHPQASAMAAFFASLVPTKLDRLRSLMMSATANNAPLSQESLNQVYNILREETSEIMIPRQPRPPKLCSTALSILATKRESYAQQQSFIRGAIEHLLQEYARGHPSEPKYNLDFVCGLALTHSPSHYSYHVNFMAATKSSLRNTLFFAEFFAAYQHHHDRSKISICCPLDMGRCFYGRDLARKIMYPDHSVDYFSRDITHGGLDTIQDTLDTDFLYFNSERDVLLTKELQRMAKQHEFKHMVPISQWVSEHPAC